MFKSWIKAGAATREAQAVEAVRAQWTGEAWRDHRAAHRVWLHAQAKREGVAFDTPAREGR